MKAIETLIIEKSSDFINTLIILINFHCFILKYYETIIIWTPWFMFSIIRLLWRRKMKKIIFILTTIILAIIAILTVTNMSDQSGLYGFNNHWQNNMNEDNVLDYQMLDMPLTANNTGLLSLKQNVYMNAFSGQTELLPYNNSLLDDSYKTIAYNDQIFILESNQELYLYNAINQEKHFLMDNYDLVHAFYDFNSLYLLIKKDHDIILYEQDMDGLLEAALFDVEHVNYINKVHENFIIMYDDETIGLMDAQGQLTDICHLDNYEISPLAMVSTEKYIYLLSEDEQINDLTSNQIYRLDYEGRLVRMLDEDYAIASINAMEANVFFIGRKMDDQFFKSYEEKDPFMTMDIIQMNETKEKFTIASTSGSTLALIDGLIVTTNSNIGIEDDFKPIAFKTYSIELK